MSGAPFQSASELTTFTRRQTAQANLTIWHGIRAYRSGKDGIKDNPYNGWQGTPLRQHSYQCLLWCRFLLGWLREYYRVNEPTEAKP